MPAPVLVSLPVRRATATPDTDRTVIIRPRSPAGLTWDDICQVRTREGSAPTTPEATVIHFPPKASKRTTTKAPRAGKASKPLPPPWERPWYRAEHARGANERIGREFSEAYWKHAFPPAKIGSTPKGVADLLRRPEWRGAVVVGTIPSPEVGAEERALDRAVSNARTLAESLAANEVAYRSATSDNVRQTLSATMGAQRANLAAAETSVREHRIRVEAVRAELWTLIRHPSGAEVRIRPSAAK